MKWLVIGSRGQLHRKFCVPGSKSHTIRALAIASLANGESIIRNPLVSGDTQSAAYTYRALGAEIDTSDPDLWKVMGTGGRISVPREPIYVGNSGTTLRIAMGSAALAQPGQAAILTGDKQIQSRPLGPLSEALSNLGAKCTSLKNNGKAPVQVTGKLKGGKTTIAASTSQYLSSLLLCTPLANEDTEIDVTLLNEPGYVQMTLDWLKKQKIELKNENMRRFRIKGGQNYNAFDTTIPADFSTATFFFCAAALLADREVTITGLDFSDSQPDKAVVDYLKAMGANIKVAPTSVTIKTAPLKGIQIDMNNTPDALPAMAVTAAFAEGTTSLVNVPQARSKETDRIAAMACELKKLAIDVEEMRDGLIIHGGRPRPAELDGRSDHRIVMALALVPLKIGMGAWSIVNVGAHSVTFPKFLDFVGGLGRGRIVATGLDYTFTSIKEKCRNFVHRIMRKKSLSRMSK